jgi:hypothetical protein
MWGSFALNPHSKVPPASGSICDPPAPIPRKHIQCPIPGNPKISAEYFSEPDYAEGTPLSG